jgi:hypothetical protein
MDYFLEDNLYRSRRMAISSSVETKNDLVSSWLSACDENKVILLLHVVGGTASNSAACVVKCEGSQSWQLHNFQIIVLSCRLSLTNPKLTSDKWKFIFKQISCSSCFGSISWITVDKI